MLAAAWLPTKSSAAGGSPGGLLTTTDPHPSVSWWASAMDVLSVLAFVWLVVVLCLSAYWLVTRPDWPRAAERFAEHVDDAFVLIAIAGQEIYDRIPITKKKAAHR